MKNFLKKNLCIILALAMLICMVPASAFALSKCDLGIHSYGNWTTTKEATCTEKGIKERKCSSCGKVDTDSINALGHSYGGWSTVTDSTCTAEGTKHRICSRCGNEDSSSIGKKDHNYVWVEGKASTCKEQGYLGHYECSDCGGWAEKVVVFITMAKTYLPLANHTYGDWTTTTEPTCTEAGIKERTCSVCDHVDTDSIKALGHSYGEWATVTDSTCTAEGTKHRICSRCGNEDFSSIGKKDHNYKYVSDGAITHSYVCEDCGHKLYTFVHEWTITNIIPSTCEEKGHTDYKCFTCGATKSEPIEALGHNYQYVKDDESHTYKCTRCDSVIAEKSGAHNMVWTDLGLTHLGVCSDCGHTDTHSVTHFDNLDLSKTENQAIATACGIATYDATKQHLNRCHQDDCTVAELANHTFIYVNNGYETHDYKCSQCGYVAIDDEAHDWNGGVTILAPTCTEKGKTLYTCKHCLETKTETDIDALGHNYVYSSLGTTLSKTCTHNILHAESVTLVSDITDLIKTYDGKAIDVKLAGKLDDLTNDDIYFLDSSGNVATTFDVGIYSANITAGGKTASLIFTIVQDSTSLVWKENIPASIEWDSDHTFGAKAASAVNSGAADLTVNAVTRPKDTTIHDVFVRVPANISDYAQLVDDIDDGFPKSWNDLKKFDSDNAFYRVINNVVDDTIFDEAPTEPGTYIEVAYTYGGNYLASPIVRAFTIERIPVTASATGYKTVTYDGLKHSLTVTLEATKDTEHFYDTNSALVFYIHKAEYDSLIKEESLDEIVKDLIANVNIPAISTVAPTDSGEYEVIAIYIGNLRYAPAVATFDLTIKKQPLYLGWASSMPTGNKLTWSEAQTFNFGYKVYANEGLTEEYTGLVNALNIYTFFGGELGDKIPEGNFDPIVAFGSYTEYVYSLNPNYDIKAISRAYEVIQKDSNLKVSNNTVEYDGTAKNVSVAADANLKGTIQVIIGADTNDEAFVSVVYTGNAATLPVVDPLTGRASTTTVKSVIDDILEAGSFVKTGNAFIDGVAELVAKHINITNTYPTAPGIYTVTVFTADMDYIPAADTAELVITRIPVEIKSKDMTVEYGEDYTFTAKAMIHSVEDPVLTNEIKYYYVHEGEYEDLLKVSQPDEIAKDIIANIINPVISLTAPKNAGTYKVIAIYAGDKTHSFAFNIYDLTIEPKELKLNWNQALPKDEELTWNEANKKFAKTNQPFDFGYYVTDKNGTPFVAPVGEDLAIFSFFGGTLGDKVLEVNYKPIRALGHYVEYVYSLNPNYKIEALSREYEITQEIASVKVEDTVTVFNGKGQNIKFTTDPNPLATVELVIGAETDTEVFASIIFSGKAAKNLEVVDPFTGEIVRDENGKAINLYKELQDAIGKGVKLDVFKDIINNIKGVLKYQSPAVQYYVSEILGFDTKTLDEIAKQLEPYSAKVTIVMDKLPSDPGLYNVTVFSADMNFVPTYDSGTLTITRIPVEISNCTKNEFVYNGQPHAIEGVKANPVNKYALEHKEAKDYPFNAELDYYYILDVDLVDLSKYTEVDEIVNYFIARAGNLTLSKMVPSQSGDYKVLVVSKGDTKYASAFRVFDLKINRATPIVSLANAEFTYDGQSHEISPATVKLVGSDKFVNDITYKYYTSYQDGQLSGEMNSLPLSAGTYYVQASLRKFENYTPADSNVATFVIKKAQPTIKVLDKESIYTGSTPTNPVEIKLVNNEHYALTGEGAVEHTWHYYADEACTNELAKAPTESGIYYVKLDLAETTNYLSAKTATEKAGKLTIYPKALVIDRFGNTFTAGHTIDTIAIQTMDGKLEVTDAMVKDWNLKDGFYEVVVEYGYKTITYTFQVKNGSLVENTDENVHENVYLDVEGDVSSAVNGLGKAANLLIAENGLDPESTKINLTLTVDSSNPNNIIKNKFTVISQNTVAKYYEMTVSMDAKALGSSQSNPGYPKTISDTKNLLEIIIPLEVEVPQGKMLTVERLHGKAPNQKLTSFYQISDKAQAKDGTFMVAGKQLVIFAEYFSTYRVSYKDIPSSSVAMYDVKLLPTVLNGKLEANHTRVGKQTTVVLTATPEKNYKLNSLKVVSYAGDFIELTDLGDGKYSFKMPASDVYVYASYQEILDCQKDKLCVINPFMDTQNDNWWHDGIHYSVDKGIMEGFSSTEFQPKGTTTRAQIVAMLWRMEGSPVVNYALMFTDLNRDWYREAIRWAASTGVVNGYSDMTFRPDAAISRQEFAAIMYRYASLKELDFAKDANTKFILPFDDKKNIKAWAEEAMNWCYVMGLITGKPGDIVDPQGFTTRAEAATMMYRFCGAVQEAK